MTSLRDNRASAPTNSSGRETLFNRLSRTDSVRKCLNEGFFSSGLPHTFRDDANQEACVAFCKVEVDKSWANGQCINYGKKIAQRTFQAVYRGYSQQCVIPRKAYNQYDPLARHSKIDSGEELVEKAMHSYGHYSADDDPLEQDAKALPSRESMGATILSDLPQQRREHVESVLQGLPESLFRMMYLVVILGYNLHEACDRMGIKYESGNKYLDRLRLALDPDESMEGL